MSLPSDPMSIAERARATAAVLKLQLRRLTRRFRLNRDLFLGEDGEPSPTAVEWLRDLGKRCHADTSTYHADPREHARREGRREVFLEIVDGMALDGKKLAALTRQMRELNDE